MLKRGKNRGLQLIVSLALSGMIFVGGQGIAMAESSYNNTEDVLGNSIIGMTGIAIIGGVQNTTMNAINMNNDAIINHLSVTNMEKKSNEEKIWVEYIHNNSRLNNSKVSTVGAQDGFGREFSTLVSYNNEANGLVLGTDFIVEKNKQIGALLNYGEGEVNSNGNISETRNDYDYWGLSLYEKWKLDKVNIIADLGYMKNSSDIKRSEILFGYGLKANVDSNILTAGIRGEFTTNVSDVTPYVGLRYVRLVTDGFNTKRNGEDFLYTPKDTQNLLLLPVGVKWSHKDTTKRGYWKQTVSAGMVYAFGDTDATTKVYIPTTGEEIFSLDFNMKDTRTFVSSLGLEGRNDNLTYGIKYQFQEANHEIANGIVVNMQYLF